MLRGPAHNTYRELRRTRRRSLTRSSWRSTGVLPTPPRPCCTRRTTSAAWPPRYRRPRTASRSSSSRRSSPPTRCAHLRSQALRRRLRWLIDDGEMDQPAQGKRSEAESASESDVQYAHGNVTHTYQHRSKLGASSERRSGQRRTSAFGCGAEPGTSLAVARRQPPLTPQVQGWCAAPPPPFHPLCQLPKPSSHTGWIPQGDRATYRLASDCVVPSDPRGTCRADANLIQMSCAFISHADDPRDHLGLRCVIVL
jgi:hypothetical protein